LTDGAIGEDDLGIPESGNGIPDYSMKLATKLIFGCDSAMVKI
jgi:hypothetical protein